MNFEEAAKKVQAFVSSMTGKPATLVKLERISENGGGWKAYVEVYEESAFIKSVGIPSKVMDRNFYEVLLNSALEVTAYARKKEIEL